MNKPKVNQKIHIIDSGEIGTITKVYPPCAEHSGRFIAYIHAKNRSYYAEFWYSDIDESVYVDTPVEKMEQNVPKGDLT